MTNDGLLVAVGQFAPTDDPDANVAEIRRLSRIAAGRGAELIVFPEYASFFENPMSPAFAAHAEPLDGPFVRALTELAAELEMHVVAGLVERAGEKFSNTLVAVNGSGVAATYRKQHLYDAFGQRESDWVVAGDTAAPETFAVRGMTVGLQTCYDIRFPEVTRRLVDAGADLVLVPAEWVRGPLKEFHWRTLVTARAIENTVYIAAADHTPPIGVGTSLIIDPMGTALAALGETTDIAVAPVSRARVAEVRAINPALALRRYDVVPRA